MPRVENPEIPDFILRNVPDHPDDITALVVEKFGISRQAANGYLQRILRENTLLMAEGKTKARRYKLKPVATATFNVDVDKGLAEDVIFREKIIPCLRFVRHNIQDIVEYGFNEMMNNVIDHSDADSCWVTFTRDYAHIVVSITDNGVGIFEKIKRECNLHDARSALLELSKGKLTTDKANHTGEGIFFTSRMFDRFCILSGDLYYSREKQEDEGDWLIESETRSQSIIGTHIEMEISTGSNTTSKEVFDRFVDDEQRFMRTHVALILAKYEGENLVSRSQARRLLRRVENFRQVVLDFRNVPEIGRAFADEIFRVFATSHPEITLDPIQTTLAIDAMIAQARAKVFADEEPSSAPASA